MSFLFLSMTSLVLQIADILENEGGDTRQRWAIPIFKGHCPPCFSIITALPTAEYLYQVCSVNQVLPDPRNKYFGLNLLEKTSRAAALTAVGIDCKDNTQSSSSTKCKMLI